MDQIEPMEVDEYFADALDTTIEAQTLNLNESLIAQKSNKEKSKQIENIHNTNELTSENPGHLNVHAIDEKVTTQENNKIYQNLDSTFEVLSNIAELVVPSDETVKEKSDIKVLDSTNELLNPNLDEILDIPEKKNKLISNVTEHPLEKQENLNGFEVFEKVAISSHTIPEISIKEEVQNLNATNELPINEISNNFSIPSDAPLKEESNIEVLDSASDCLNPNVNEIKKFVQDTNNTNESASENQETLKELEIVTSTSSICEKANEHLYVKEVEKLDTTIEMLANEFSENVKVDIPLDTTLKQDVDPKVLESTTEFLNPGVNEIRKPMQDTNVCISTPTHSISQKSNEDLCQKEAQNLVTTIDLPTNEFSNNIKNAMTSVATLKEDFDVKVLEATAGSLNLNENEVKKLVVETNNKNECISENHENLNELEIVTTFICEKLNKNLDSAIVLPIIENSKYENEVNSEMCEAAEMKNSNDTKQPLENTNFIKEIEPDSSSELQCLEKAIPLINSVKNIVFHNDEVMNSPVLEGRPSIALMGWNTPTNVKDTFSSNEKLCIKKTLFDFSIRESGDYEDLENTVCAELVQEQNELCGNPSEEIDYIESTNSNKENVNKEEIIPKERKSSLKSDDNLGSFKLQPTTLANITNKSNVTPDWTKTADLSVFSDSPSKIPPERETIFRLFYPINTSSKELIKNATNKNITPENGDNLDDLELFLQTNGKYAEKMEKIIKEKNDLQEEVNVLKQKLNDVQIKNADVQKELLKKDEIIVKLQNEDENNKIKFKDELKAVQEQVESKQKQCNDEVVSELIKENSKLKQINCELDEKVMKLSEDINENNKILRKYDDLVASKVHEYNNLQQECEVTRQHLSALEMAFSDVHKKYERTKDIIIGFKTNEEVLTESLKKSNEIALKYEERYEALKIHAKAQLDKASRDMVDIKENHYGEINKLKTTIKRLEIKCVSVQQLFDQKSEECLALSALCDEVTGAKKK